MTDDRPVVGVGALIRRGDEILLVQRSRDPGRGLWAVPGGKVRFGESMRSAVEREILEETGLQVRAGNLVWTGEIIESGVHLVLLDYEAAVVGGDLRAADDAADARWVPLAEARNMPLTPTMFDLLDTLGV